MPGIKLGLGQVVGPRILRGAARVRVGDGGGHRDDVGQPGAGEREVEVGEELDGVLGLGSQGRSDGVAGDGESLELRVIAIFDRPRQEVAQVHHRRAGHLQPHAEKLQVPDVVFLRDLVHLEQHRLRDVGEKLQERDAGVGDVVVGPLGAAQADLALHVVDDVLELTVVEVGGGQGHGLFLSGDRVEGEHKVALAVRRERPVADADDHAARCRCWCAGRGRARR